jgi:hypothetical protein
VDAAMSVSRAPNRHVTPERDAPATERDLWRIWEGRRLPVELRTRDGQALRVLFPGLANTDAGPDFVGAFLCLDNAPPRRGDVELHLEATSWERHGHHHDSRYDRVILHVVLLDDGGPAHTSAGVPIPLLALGPILARGRDPTVEASHPGPCHEPAAPREPVPDLESTLFHAGIERFERRVTLWQAELQAKPLEDCVLLALLRSAGLGKNAEPCASLAGALDGATLEALLTADRQRATEIAEAVLLGMSGLLEPAHAGGETRELWQTYRDFWPGRPLAARAWRRFRVRPANLPESRLRLVAALAGRAGIRQFFTDLVHTVESTPAPVCADWIALLSTEGHSAGRSWGLEAVANILLPLAAAYARDGADEALAGHAISAYVSLPGGGQNSLLDRMTLIAGLRATPRGAVEQQGLLHLWATHCSKQYCEDCPLAAGRH